MFPPPQILETEVFARVPDSLRVRNRRSSWIDRKRPGETLDCFLEGPCFDRDGNLYLVDIPYGRIFCVSPSGDFTVICEYDGWPNGLRVRDDGAIFIADNKNGIVTLDRASGKITPVVPELPTGPLKGPNDLILSSNGDLYFTDQGDTSLSDPTGRLVRLRADGKIDVLLDNVPSPNGLVLNKSEKALYLAVTRGNAIWHMPLRHNDKPLIKVGIFIQLSGAPGGGPDGLAMDNEDNLVVAHLGMGTVWMFSHLGEPLYRIRSCAGLATTNVAFCGLAALSHQVVRWACDHQRRILRLSKYT